MNGRLPFEKQSKQMLTGSEAEDVLQTRQAMYGCLSTRWQLEQHP